MLLCQIIQNAEGADSLDRESQLLRVSLWYFLESISFKYHPTSFTKVYIEGISETGKNDVMQGIVFILAGIILSAAGIFLEKQRKR